MDQQAPDSRMVPEEPGPQARLEAEFFANALDDCVAAQGTTGKRRERLLDLVDTFYNHAICKLEQLGTRPLGARSHSAMEVDEIEGEVKSLNVDQETRRWELEAQTWDLMRRILPLRYPEKTKSTTREIRPVAGPHKTDDLWNSFILDSRPAVERRAVLEWLQHSATRGPDVDDVVRELQQNAERGEIIAHGWIHTRTALKLHKEILGTSCPLNPRANHVSASLSTSAGAPLVSQLDPDAVLRQGRQLQPQDEYFERAIWTGCFQLLRRGCSLDTLRDWCAERTETWRAVSMSAFPVPKNGPQSDSKQDASALALWRRMCFALARSGGTDEVEKAVYGILSGDIQSVEKVCKTWDDLMFMHYNSLLRSEFDDYVLSQCPPEVSASMRQSFAIFDAVQYHGDAATADKRLVKSLSNNPQTRGEASEPLKMLQSAVICNELSQYFYDQGLVLSQTQRVSGEKDALESGRRIDRLGPGDLRIVAHLLILLSTFDKLCLSSSQPPTLSSEIHRRRVQEMIISEYVCTLRLAGLEELLPLYCSNLEVPHAYEVLSNNFRHITDRDARLNQLKLIEKSGLDVLQFVKVQTQLAFGRLEKSLESLRGRPGVFRIMEDGPTSPKYGRLIKTDFFGEDPDAVDSDHENLICSLEWLLLVDNAWPHMFGIGVRAYKCFLRTMHLNAARQLANRVSFHQILQQRLDPRLRNDLELSWVLEEDEHFWATQLTSTDNQDLSPVRLVIEARILRDLEYLVRTLDTMETIAALTVLSREDPSARRDFWTQVGNEVKNAKEFVQPLLNGWLLAKGEDPDLQAIRETYLPETVLAYISTLHFAGTCLFKDNLLECMDVAAAIAGKHSDIAACFVKSRRIHDLVEVFSSCSKALAVSAGEKKVTGSTNKRMRELGWSRDLWRVNS
ncbi:hypothetical protein SODALDRAFT_332255 [Sodiomyces alkalinus F11]|uniref:Nuclear pore complex protein n=1 Tax=Sodiomyces alkalinus (strain CBS 110278 / VKM F-3762 / F11) TaxID=1314773 RepID=A0A3N2Q023_SODAK|nr:hypothetical protein SODALDRAFT_332255 [Sodiomyces alkalinus F11]ROT40093.1 hypothetical protein SODALDRAFT_332255 [Sodiomyces alkalinus F11]